MTASLGILSEIPSRPKRWEKNNCSSEQSSWNFISGCGGGLPHWCDLGPWELGGEMQRQGGTAVVTDSKRRQKQPHPDHTIPPHGACPTVSQVSVQLQLHCWFLKHLEMLPERTSKCKCFSNSYQKVMGSQMAAPKYIPMRKSCSSNLWWLWSEREPSLPFPHP